MSHTHAVDIRPLGVPFRGSPACPVPKEDETTKTLQKVRSLLEGFWTPAGQAGLAGLLFAGSQVGPLILMCRVLNG